MHHSGTFTRQRWLVAFALSWLALIALPAWAQKPNNITTGELALLPEYCKDTQSFGYGDAVTNTSPRAPHWVSKMGQAFWAMHHYCWALIRVGRATAPGVDPAMRKGHLEAAIQDYLYVIKHSKPEFVLLPEIYTRIGEAQIMLGAHGEALQAFTTAREIKPDYWPPYVRWADVLAQVGKRKEAREHVEMVLRLTPNDALARSHYKRLGGDPVAFVKTLPPPAAAAASSPVAGATEAASSPAPATPAEPAASATTRAPS